MKQPGPRFLGIIALLFVTLGSVQLIASLLFYQAIDRQTLQEDHARRIAELLVVSNRIHTFAPERTSATVSTRYLTASVAEGPSVRNRNMTPMLKTVANEIVAWEPGLAGRDLRLAIRRNHAGGTDLVGSIIIANGRWLNFRSADIGSMWPIASRAVTVTLASAVASMVIGLFLLHALGKPLRELTAAAKALGHGRKVEVRESGPRDLRNLAEAMNAMQARIERLLRDQAQSFEAISHDLRTPLARQKIAADLVEDPEIGLILRDSVMEMDDLLNSLQAFLRAQHVTAEAEEVDLTALAHEVASPFGEKASVVSDGPLPALTFREPVRLALAALVENAVQFGSRATITISVPGKGSPQVLVEDQGPGIDACHFESILDPFFRLDAARARDTRGFGLGIPTAHRLMMRFNGSLRFSRGANGGLVAALTIPRPDELA